MFARRTTQPRPRKTQPHRFVAPVAGWVANRALADSNSFQGPGAQVMDNFFPRATSVNLRRGMMRYASLGNDPEPVTALFSYKNGLNQRLFAATTSSIYDVTAIPWPYDIDLATESDDIIAANGDDWFGWYSTDHLVVSDGYTGGNWIVTQFATSGGVYLVGVNGQDNGFIFDGTSFYPWIDGGVTRLNYDGETTGFTAGSVVTGATSGATGTIWKVVPGTSGAGYLLLTDVSSTPFDDDEPITDTAGGTAVVDGVQEIAAPGVSFKIGSSPSGLTTADMSYVWAYKNRLFFAERHSMNAWYMGQPDAVGGDADIFPLSGVFTVGGSLMFGSPWSMDSSGDGGLSEQCVFVSSEGEVAVYQGNDPSSAQNWSKVGTYRIGRPLGSRAFIRGGGDLAIATSVGLVPLSKAISLDVTALNVATVSNNIADAWDQATTERGTDEWVCEVWPEEKMAVISPPNPIGVAQPVLFVSNTETGAWARFTGWHALCMEVFQGQLYFGSQNGCVYLANVSGEDDGEAYTGSVIPLYTDFGNPFAEKVPGVARARSRSSGRVIEKIDAMTDFDDQIPAAPDAGIPTNTNVWDAGVWGSSKWSSEVARRVNQDWQSVGGIGYSLSLCYQVTSGSLSPLDVELLDMEVTYTTAELVT